MKNVVIIFACIYITGCTIIGGEIGREIDEGLGVGGDEYETALAEVGLEADIEILTAIYNNMGKEEVTVEEIDTIACKKPSTRQVCTALKGCWCE